MTVNDIPALNAALNTTATLLLLWGYSLIRRRNFEAHKKVMLAAFATSILFLVSYLVYHYNVGSVKFQKTGSIRTVYFAILISHTVLAAAVPLMAIITLRRALGARLDEVPVSSVKGAVGHCLCAAGAVEAAITALAVARRTAPPTAGFAVPDPACPVDPIPGAGRAMPIRVALSSSFAFGGNAAVLAFGRPA